MFIKLIIFFIFTLLSQNIWSETNIHRREDNCVVKFRGQNLHEGDTMDVKGKYYKVEDCQLQRAYHACGTHIIVMLNIVCEAVERHKKIPSNERFSRFIRQKLLTEACCQSLCTVSEMTRYCP
jgi:hypothetical protein